MNQYEQIMQDKQNEVNTPIRLTAVGKLALGMSLMFIFILVMMLLSNLMPSKPDDGQTPEIHLIKGL